MVLWHITHLDCRSSELIDIKKACSLQAFFLSFFLVFRIILKLIIN